MSRIYIPATSIHFISLIMVSLTPSGKMALDNFIVKIIEEKKLPCVTYGVSTVDDEEIYFNYGGCNSVDDPSSGQINRDSIFRICSQTKLITHLAALQLIEKGKLQADSPVSAYLPVFENPIILDDFSAENPSFKPATKVVRVEHLLNFSSGLFYPKNEITVLPCPYTAKHDEEDPVGHFYDLIKGDLPYLPLNFEPGTDFAYGYSSDTLGFIVEKITGQTLEQYCQENIFRPLGMTTTSFYLTPKLKAKLVNLAISVNGKFEPFVNQIDFIEQDPSQLKLHLGGVGLYSSLKDYLAVLRHLLQIKVGKTPPNPILLAKTVEKIFAPSLPLSAIPALDFFVTGIGVPAGNQWSTALSLRTEDLPERRKKGSAYWSGWAGTFGHIDPETGIAAFFATQVPPSPDGEPSRVHDECERILYSNLEKD